MRLSFVADLVQALVWLLFAMALYRLLQHAGRDLAHLVVHRQPEHDPDQQHGMTPTRA